MLRGQYTVWVWYSGDVPIYVGWGKLTAESHPADRTYAKAQSGANPSALSTWLEANEPPPRKDFGRWGKDDARLLANAMRAKLRRQGRRLLTSKPFDRCVGGGTSRQVKSPRGTIFGSVRMAADVYKVNPSTILRWCVAKRGGWSYLETSDEDND